jgi:hypothetical protein
MILDVPKATTDNNNLNYDARKRDPQFAHASDSPLWELVRRSNTSSRSHRAFYI